MLCDSHSQSVIFDVWSGILDQYDFTVGGTTQHDTAEIEPKQLTKYPVARHGHS